MSRGDSLWPSAAAETLRSKRVAMDSGTEADVAVTPPFALRCHKLHLSVWDAVQFALLSELLAAVGSIHPGGRCYAGDPGVD